MYFCQISKCFCLNLQNIFVSNCKMCYSQIAKCFGLKQQNQQNKLASAVFFWSFFLKLFFSLCTNSSAIWTGICGKSPVIELSQTAQWLSQCSLDHKMTVKITKIRILDESIWGTWIHWKPVNVLPKASELVRLTSPGKE